MNYIFVCSSRIQCAWGMFSSSQILLNHCHAQLEHLPRKMYNYESAEPRSILGLGGLRFTAITTSPKTRMEASQNAGLSKSPPFPRSTFNLQPFVFRGWMKINMIWTYLEYGIFLNWIEGKVIVDFHFSRNPQNIYRPPAPSTIHIHFKKRVNSRPRSSIFEYVTHSFPFNRQESHGWCRP